MASQELSPRRDFVPHDKSQGFFAYVHQSLVQLEQNAEQIKDNDRKALARRQAKEQKKSLFEIFHDEINEEQDERACLICEL